MNSVLPVRKVLCHEIANLAKIFIRGGGVNADLIDQGSKVDRVIDMSSRAFVLVELFLWPTNAQTKLLLIAETRKLLKEQVADFPRQILRRVVSD